MHSMILFLAVWRMWYLCDDRPAALGLEKPQAPLLARPPVQFELNITSAKVDVLGIGSRDVILVNGTFVGPTLRVKQGDQVEFLVRNHLGEDTSMHFHGIGQRNTPWSDGVPGLTQRQIHAGASFLYKWKADDAGTYFYHAHSKGQLMDGLYGSIVIDAPPEASRPFHLIAANVSEEHRMRAAETQNQPLMMGDWSQYKFDDFFGIQTRANFDLACTDSIIVNGIGSLYCLPQAALDNMTSPVVFQLLKQFGEDHLTPKGCFPPLRELQGDYDVDLAKIPPQAVVKCVGGRNPKGNFTFNVDEKLGWAALTFVNVGGLDALYVAIDNHELHVYAVDGQYVRPAAADRVYVANGNRVSVLVKLDQEPARYTVRVANAHPNQILGGFAEMAYGGATHAPRRPQPAMDFGGQPLIEPLRSFMPEQGRPYPETRPARRADRTVKLVLRRPGPPHGAYEWSLAGHALYNTTAEAQDPPLLFRDPARCPRGELVVASRLGDWVDVVLETEGPLAISHPIHKHGTKAYFLGSGIGRFSWASVDEAERSLAPGSFNFENPAHLDTFATPEIAGEAAAVWAVLRYKADSPGAWLLHCHIQTHLSSGMGVVLLDGVDRFPEVPVEYRERNGFDKQP